MRRWRELASSRKEGAPKKEKKEKKEKRCPP